MKTNWETGTDMARGVAIAAVIILMGAVTSASAAEEYYLYKPEKVHSQSIPTPGSGVLTKAITIQKGDTLSKLSARYSGRSAFFPQILLFNRIKNPDLIYAGAQLQVPLSQQAALSPQGKEKPGAVRKRRHATHKSAVRREKRIPSEPTSEPTVFGVAGERLFKRGVRAFEARDYRQAIETFDEFLANYPNSPNAADATLYRAECYEKLSGV
jgi:LysM repeat protein